VKKDGTLYGGSLYQLSNTIDGIMTGGRNVELRRFKGLGEMNADLLRETAMNPETRKIIKVTMDDAKEAGKWFNILLGGSDMGAKKDLFLS
jgi:DNA gyrase subunit B